jgi:chromate transporter
MAATFLLVFGDPLMQLVALAAGAVGGMIFCREVQSQSVPPKLPVSRRAGIVFMAMFLALLAGLPLAAHAAPRSTLAMVAVFYRAGALVFGGGHVVLPLLRDALVPSGWISDNAFLSGYGAAQAVPGPLFTFAAFLGASIAPHGSGIGVAGLWSLAALVFIFLPGMLVALAGLPLWNWIGHLPVVRGALAGVNAAVVGVLGAALYNPIWTSAILTARDFAIALIAFVLLERWRTPPIIIVIFCVVAAVTMALA